MLRVDINLLFTVINLLIIYFIIRKFLFKPVHKILDQRKEEIDKQYADAKEVQEQANALKTQYEEAMSNVDKEKAEVVSQARAKASEEYEHIVSDASHEADKLMDQARKQATVEHDRILKQAQDEIEELVVAAAEKVVASGQGHDADVELYNQFLAKTGEES